MGVTVILDDPFNICELPGEIRNRHSGLKRSKHHICDLDQTFIVTECPIYLSELLNILRVNYSEDATKAWI